VFTKTAWTSAVSLRAGWSLPLRRIAMVHGQQQCPLSPNCRPQWLAGSARPGARFFPEIARCRRRGHPATVVVPISDPGPPSGTGERTTPTIHRPTQTRSDEDLKFPALLPPGRVGGRPASGASRVASGFPPFGFWSVLSLRTSGLCARSSTNLRLRRGPPRSNTVLVGLAAAVRETSTAVQTTPPLWTLVGGPWSSA